MDPFGSSKKKSNKKSQDSLDDLLGDLLEPDETPKKKPAQGRGRAAGKGGGREGDFYSNLAAMAENDVESDVSDADVEKIAKSISGLDDMDADLFGDSLKKKGSVKGSSKQSTPRRGPTTPRSSSITPRSAAERGATPTRSETPTSPPGSARGSLKRKPVKPTASASASASSQLEPKPGTAPDRLSDIGRASENLKPGQMNREEKRPNTTPKPKPKYDFGDFDEDDPLAGLSLDEESVSEAGKKSAAKKAGVTKQKSAEEEPKTTPQPAAQPSSPRKPNLFDRPPTRSGSGNLSSEAGDSPQAPQVAQAKPEAAGKRKDDLIFSDDDNFLDGLGIDANEKKAPPPPAAANTASSSAAASAAPPRPGMGGDEDQRPARSVLDSLLGRGEKSAASHLEVKEKPRQFVLDKKYTQPKEEKKEEEDDFLFGSYQPSAASGGGSRPSSRRSVRFQDDDDIFGEPSESHRPHSGSSARKNIPDDMRWLEELTSGETSSNKTVTTPSVPSVAPSSPAKTPAAARPTSPVKKPEETITIPKESPREKPVQSGLREGSPDRAVESKPKKPDPKDWLGLKDSDSEGEFFIPKKVPSRSPGISESTPRTPPSSRPIRSPPKAPSVTSDGGQKKDDDDDEEEDSFIVRARLRRQQAMANQTKVKVADPEPSVADAHPIIPESPKFQGSVPAALQNEAQAPRDLFAFPPTRTTSTPKFKTGIKGSQSSGFVATPEDAVESGQTRAPVATLGQRQGAVLTGGTEQPPRVFQSSHFPSSAMGNEGGGDTAAMAGRSVQLQQQQLQQQQQLPPQWQPAPAQPAPVTMATSLAAGTFGYYPQQHVQMVGHLPLPATYSSVSVSHEPIPASLEEAAARIRKLEIEKQYAESLLETTRKRYEEEVTAVEKSYKNRIQILEEANQKTEARLRGEMEQLMEQHLARVKRMEQEKADLAAENYRRLEDQERTFAQETEKLKEKHRQMVADLKREHEEAQQQLVEAKNKEIQKVASAHDTSKSLSAAVDQIQSNARDLGQLQIKMDEWNRSGLDEREIVLRSKDEQLNMLQARLKKQEEDNEKERYRLEDLIARMESQNRDQLRQLEEERWKLKQEQSRLEAQQTALETERRTWTEQQARERQSMDRARDMFLEEQQSGLSHLTDERRALAEERSKLNMEQKLHRERVQQEAVRSAQAQAEYDVLTKTISEEKTRAAERMRELQREEERINRERDSFHQRSAALEQEKERLEKLALNLKQRSAELDAVSEEANRARAEGDQAFTEAQLLQSQQSQRMAEIEAQVASIKIMEDHIAQEKLRLAKEKKDVENLKQAGMCVNCRNGLNGAVPHVVQPRLGSMLAGSVLTGTPVAGAPVHQGSLPAMGTAINAMPYETVASTIAGDRAVRMWKIQAIKDQEYLEEESLFLEGLKHSPYHSSSKI